MTRPRIHLGRDLVVVEEDDQGVQLEGERRLSPGRTVEVVREGPALAVRVALVSSWQLIAMGRGRPRYRGYCRWS
jgi:hypothetical protein